MDAKDILNKRTLGTKRTFAESSRFAIPINRNNLVRQHYGKEMPGKTPLERLRGLGYDLPREGLPAF